MNNKKAKIHHEGLHPKLYHFVDILQKHGNVDMDAIMKNLKCKTCQTMTSECTLNVEPENMVATVWCKNITCTNHENRWHVCFLCTNFSTHEGAFVTKVSRHCKECVRHKNAMKKC